MTGGASLLDYQWTGSVHRKPQVHTAGPVPLHGWGEGTADGVLLLREKRRWQAGVSWREER